MHEVDGRRLEFCLVMCYKLVQQVAVIGFHCCKAFTPHTMISSRQLKPHLSLNTGSLWLQLPLWLAVFSKQERQQSLSLSLSSAFNNGHREGELVFMI